MFRLAPVSFLDIQQYFVDYQKKSKNFEMPPEEAENLGIFKEDRLIGYFITIAREDDKVIEINQGYLIPEARHKRMSDISLGLLEQLVKKVGYKRIEFGTNRAVGSYIKFMDKLGYKLTRAIFAKEVQ